MKLNKQDLNNYRRVINEALKDVEELHSIKLPNEMIDELLFGEVEEKRMKEFKFSLDAIENLDLSEYSFEDVSFNSDIPVNLSNINAKIDFHKCFTYKIGRDFKLRNINFSGTDLSEANIKGVKEIINCDLSNTNIEWPSDYFNATNTNFTNTDMGRIYVPLTALTKYGYNDAQSFKDCIFTNTGLHLTVKNNERLKYMYANFGAEVKEERRRVTAELVKSGAILGCYINSELIKPKEEYKKIADEMTEEYNKFKNQKTEKALRLIKAQNSSGGKIIL